MIKKLIALLVVAMYAGTLNAQKNSIIVFSEIHYNPLDSISNNGITLASGDEFEFIEIHNISNNDYDLTGCQFLSGIYYPFPSGSIIKAGDYLVISKNNFYFYQRYKKFPFGQYTFDTESSKLSNKGEKLILIDSKFDTLCMVDYEDSDPWSPIADGLGFSLVLTDYSDPENPDNWRASSNIGGSPGSPDPEIKNYGVIINEILANSVSPEVDFIELYNTSDEDIDISGWFITDDIETPNEWIIPANTVVEAHQYIVFQEGEYQGDLMIYSNKNFGEAFSISSSGESIFLFSANANGKLTGYYDYQDFLATEEGISLGIFKNSIGINNFTAMSQTTKGAENSNPKIGPLVISEIMYNSTGGGYEYLKVTNITSNAVALYDPLNPENSWDISGIGLKKSLLAGQSIGANESAYFVEDSIDLEQFRNVLEISENTLIFNYEGNLSNGGETIRLEKPAAPKIEIDTVIIPYIEIDKIKYDDNNPWYPDADGTGGYLKRKDNFAYGNDPNNWEVVFGIPVADAGTNQTISVNSTVFLDGRDSYDPSGLAITYEWEIVSKPLNSSAALSDSKIVNPTFTADKAGTYKISLIVSNGKNQSFADEVIIDTETSEICQFENSEIKVYPLITNSIINIETSESSNYTYFLEDINGKIITQGNSYKNNFSLSLDSFSLKSGIYFLKLYLNNNTVFKKIIYSVR